MMHKLFAVFLLPLLLAAAGTCGDDAKKELAKFRGAWFAEALEHNGSTNTRILDPLFNVIKVVGQGEVLFAGDKMTLVRFLGPPPKGKPGDQPPDFYQPEFTVKLLPSKSPKAIDLTALNGPRKGKTAPGIYHLQGDVLRLCLPMGDGDRPSEFKSPKASDLLVLTLQRDNLTLEGARPTVLSPIAFSPDGKVLASIEDHTRPVKPEGGLVDRGAFVGIVLWDVDKRKVIANIRHTGGVSSVAFSPDGNTLATTTHTPAVYMGHGAFWEVKIWDVPMRKEKASLKSKSNDFHSVAFSPDAKTLASGGMNAGETGTTGGRADDLGVKLWDLSTLKEKVSLKGHAGPVFSVGFSPDGKLIASGSGRFASNGQYGDGEVKLWDTVTGRERASLNGRGEEFLSVVLSVALSPDGKTVASAHVFGDVVLWDVASGKRTATLQRFTPTGKEEDINGTYSVAFSPDGKTVAAGRFAASSSGT